MGTKTKSRIRKIERESELSSLERGEVICVEERGLLLYHNLNRTTGEMLFYGRMKGQDIIKCVEIGIKNIAIERGKLVFNKPYNLSFLRRTKNPELYDGLDYLLKEAKL